MSAPLSNIGSARQFKNRSTSHIYVEFPPSNHDRHVKQLCSIFWKFSSFALTTGAVIDRVKVKTNLSIFDEEADSNHDHCCTAERSLILFSVTFVISIPWRTQSPKYTAGFFFYIIVLFFLPRLNINCYFSAILGWKSAFFWTFLDYRNTKWTMPTQRQIM